MAHIVVNPSAPSNGFQLEFGGGFFFVQAFGRMLYVKRSGLPLGEFARERTGDARELWGLGFYVIAEPAR